MDNNAQYDTPIADALNNLGGYISARDPSLQTIYVL